MAKARTMYRGHRRAACFEAKGVWPKDGVQLDPVYYRPTANYAQEIKPTTIEMFKKKIINIRSRALGRGKANV